MAEPTLGEAYSNQGVYRNPQSSFGAFAQGLQAGGIMQQRREAKDQKINDLISKSVQVDPAQFISPLYGKAKEETVGFLQNAHKLRQQYGDRRFMYTPEFQQAKADYDMKIANWKAESAKFNERDKLAAQGKVIVDPNYLKAGKSDYNTWASYKNDLTGEYVDPNTGTSNVNAIPAYDLQKNIGNYFSSDDPYFYDIKGTTRKLGGGSNDFVVQWNLNPEKVKERAAVFANDHPELAASYLRTRPEEVKAISAQMVQEAAAQGRELKPENLAQGAAIRLVEQEMIKRLSKFREEKVNVPEYKDTGSGAGNKTQQKYNYTPTIAPAEVIKQVNVPFDPETGQIGVTGQLDVPIQEDSPFISVQYSGSEGDNKPLDIPLVTSKGKIVEELAPLGFSKPGNDWIFIGKKTVKINDKEVNMPKAINMTKDKEAAARIANYFGYKTVGEYIDFLNAKVGSNSTKKGKKLY